MLLKGKKYTGVNGKCDKNDIFGIKQKYFQPTKNTIFFFTKTVEKYALTINKIKNGDHRPIFPEKRENMTFFFFFFFALKN